MIKPGKAEKWAARSARLSAALRENLKRRKEQARGRKAEDVAAADAGVGAAPDFRRHPGGEGGGGLGGPRMRVWGPLPTSAAIGAGKWATDRVGLEQAAGAKNGSHSYCRRPAAPRRHPDLGR